MDAFVFPTVKINTSSCLPLDVWGRARVVWERREAVIREQIGKKKTGRNERRRSTSKVTLPPLSKEKTKANLYHKKVIVFIKHKR